MFISRVQLWNANWLLIHFLILHLIYQVSDKRLLPRCGTGKGYLIETQSASSDLRVCASREPKPERMDCVPGCSVYRGNRKRSFTDWVTGLQRTEGFGPEGTWKVAWILRDECSIRLNDASSRNSASAEERTAERRCRKKYCPDAQGCTTIS